MNGVILWVVWNGFVDSETFMVDFVNLIGVGCVCVCWQGWTCTYSVVSNVAIDNKMSMVTSSISYRDIFWPYSRPNSFRGVQIYCIRIWILKYHVDIESYLIRHDWNYPYSNPNSTRNMKINMISMIFVRIQFIFIPNLIEIEYERVRS